MLVESELGPNENKYREIPAVFHRCGEGNRKKIKQKSKRDVNLYEYIFQHLT